MNQSRLNSLALLSIEKETLNSIDFTSITDEFASIKTRRVHLYTEYTHLVYLALMLCISKCMYWCSAVL